jgi:hypothetical protein
VNDNLITDFIGLESLPRLHTLILDRNPIISLKGFPSLPELTHLSMLGTPISELHNFRALALIVAGPQLKVLNGVDVTTNDRSGARALGCPGYELEASKIVRPPSSIERERASGLPDFTANLIVRGWIPRRPVFMPFEGRSQDAKEEKRTAAADRVIRLVDRQENDPISLRMVRLLRTTQYDTSGIRRFLRNYFSPGEVAKKDIKTESSMEAQIERQQAIIDVLAAQLQALRTGNSTINQYNEMLNSVAKILIKNSEKVRGYESGMDDYDALRKSAIDYLGVDERTTDNELIKMLKNSGMDDEPLVSNDGSDADDAEYDDEREMNADGEVPNRTMS